MGRKRKGRNLSGWLIVDKPAGVGSTDVVNKARWRFQAQKAGHAGTLDPDATGLLAVAFGEATKIIPYVTDDLKAYDFIVRFGAATTTDDASGEVIHESDMRPSDAEIIAALPQFEGNIQQVPPQFSAVKVDGKRAYDLAREGETVEIAARPLFVESLTLEARPEDDLAILRLVCGKGGYVRSIARDLGEALGCFAHVETLRRVWSGPFEEADMVPYSALEQEGDIDDLLLPKEIGLAELPRALLNADGATRLRNGNPGQVINTEGEAGDLVWGAYEDEAIAIGHVINGMLHPQRVFNG